MSEIAERYRRWNEARVALNRHLLDGREWNEFPEPARVPATV